MNNRIKQLRKSMDLTQQEFANRIGVKRNTVATYEMGRCEPSDSAIALICREFNVDENWLRTGIGTMFLPSSNSALDSLAIENNLNEQEKAIIERFLKMKPESRNTIIKFIQEMATLMNSEIESTIDIQSAEAEYEKALGIVPNTKSTVLNTIDDIKNA